MKILVTGGLGFIGSNFIRTILNKYQEIQIVNLDYKTYAGNLENLKDIENDSRYQLVLGNICDAHLVNELFKIHKFDQVVHFAAESHVDRSIDNPLSFIDTDVKGTGILLEAAKVHGIQRFVHISTDEVYGSIDFGKSKENDVLKARNPYSASKVGAEKLAYAYFITYGLPVIITRGSNNFGPFQFPEKLIPLFITNLIDGLQVPLYGDGLNKRDWIYVIDHCEAIDLVRQEGKPGEIYNIGGGNERTNYEITHLLIKLCNKDITYIKPVEDRKGHDRRYAVDCSKINALGWKPRFDFEQAMVETVGWYQNNRSWWEKLKK